MSKIEYLLTSSYYRIFFYRLRKIFQVQVEFWEEFFVNLSLVCLSTQAERSEARVESHTGRKLTKNSSQNKTLLGKFSGDC